MSAAVSFMAASVGRLPGGAVRAERPGRRGPLVVRWRPGLAGLRVVRRAGAAFAVPAPLVLRDEPRDGVHDRGQRRLDARA